MDAEIDVTSFAELLRDALLLSQLKGTYDVLNRTPQIAASAIFGNLPFQEAIDYFKRKINIPTQTWHDLYGTMHARAFVVAGAMKMELLDDLREAVEKALTEGISIDSFRESFAMIVKKHGWEYHGTEAWRSSLIYNTNCDVAYNAGRYKQMTESTELKAFPFWRYRSMDDAKVRPMHQSWNNIVLKSDDAWWGTHYPPNGWGCRCYVQNLSQKMLDRLKEKENVTMEAPDDGAHEWKNPETGEIRSIPSGIDPGWDYNPGQAAWGGNQ
jgi:SPP1 gp7 family putative phage head morphogenesis protein